MKNLILIILLIFGLNSFAQEKVNVIHFNYKWNDRNNYDLRGIVNAKIQYAWLEDQPFHIRDNIKTVPVVVILGRDGKVKMQYTADLSFKLKVSPEEIQKMINKIFIEN